MKKPILVTILGLGAALSFQSAAVANPDFNGAIFSGEYTLHAGNRYYSNHLGHETDQMCKYKVTVSLASNPLQMAHYWGVKYSQEGSDYYSGSISYVYDGEEYRWVEDCINYGPRGNLILPVHIETIDGADDISNITVVHEEGGQERLKINMGSNPDKLERSDNPYVFINNGQKYTSGTDFAKYNIFKVDNKDYIPSDH